MQAHNKVKASKIIKPNLSLEMWHEKEYILTITMLSIDLKECTIHYKVNERTATSKRKDFEDDVHRIAQGHLPTKIVIKNDGAIDVFEFDTWVKRNMTVYTIKKTHGIGVKRMRDIDNEITTNKFQSNIYDKFCSFVSRYFEPLLRTVAVNDLNF